MPHLIVASVATQKSARSSPAACTLIGRSGCVDSPTPTGLFARGRTSRILMFGQYALRTSAVSQPAEPAPTIATEFTGWSTSCGSPRGRETSRLLGALVRRAYPRRTDEQLPPVRERDVAAVRPERPVLRL